MPSPAVYILECSDGSLYTGSTTDIEKRLHEHNYLKSGAHYTKIRRPVKLVYFEPLETLGEARKKENAIKALTRDQKLRLVKSATSSDNSPL